VIEKSQVVVHEGDEPDFIGRGLDAYVLSSEDLTEVDLALAQANTAAMSDGDGSVVKRYSSSPKAATRAAR
jgi:hypothetical protein